MPDLFIFIFTEESCPVTISQYSFGRCKMVREKATQMNKLFYKLTNDETKAMYPHLDQPMTNTLAYFMTEKFHAHWFAVYFNIMMKQSKTIVTPYLHLKYKHVKMTSYDKYFQIANEMKNAILVRKYSIYSGILLLNHSFGYYCN